jgi:hypothetical protein
VLTESHPVERAKYGISVNVMNNRAYRDLIIRRLVAYELLNNNRVELHNLDSESLSIATGSLGNQCQRCLPYYFGGPISSNDGTSQAYLQMDGHRVSEVSMFSVHVRQTGKLRARTSGQSSAGIIISRGPVPGLMSVRTLMGKVQYHVFVCNMFV